MKLKWKKDSIASGVYHAKSNHFEYLIIKDPESPTHKVYNWTFFINYPGSSPFGITEYNFKDCKLRCENHYETVNKGLK